jgi:GT2 family glycosyltransferase
VGQQDNTSLVSIIIVTYNSQEDIVDCIRSVLIQTHQEFEVIAIDNNSADNTVEMLRENFGGNSKVSIVASRSNMGYAGGNNLGFRHAKGEFIAILNPDTIVASNWLEELLKAYYENQADAGIVCSNVLLFDRKEVINACGNEIHLTGLVFSRFYMEGECRCAEGGKVVPAPSGASMLFSKERLKRIGREEPFDTSRFQMEYSDIDLAIDFLANGFRCYVAPKSRVYHKYKFKMTPERLYSLEKGRYEILSHLTKSTRLHLISALVLAEVIVWGFILSKRQDLFASKLRVCAWNFVHTISQQARKNNSAKKDLQLLSVMTPMLSIYREISTKDEDRSFVVSSANNYFKKVRDGLIGRLSST